MAQYRYNGNIIVKKSSREDYKYAVVTLGEDGKYYKVFISTTREKVETMMKTHINQYYRNIENNRNAIKAIEAGKTFFIDKFNSRSFRNEINEEGIPYYERWIASYEKEIERIGREWKVVEIEKV